MLYKIRLRSWWTCTDETPYPLKVPMSYDDNMLIDPADEIVNMMDGLIFGIDHKTERNEYDTTTI